MPTWSNISPRLALRGRRGAGDHSASDSTTERARRRSGPAGKVPITSPCPLCQEPQVPYIEGFVAAVPTANKEQYIEQARTAAAYFKSLGATRLVEGWGDDVPK